MYAFSLQKLQSPRMAGLLLTNRPDWKATRGGFPRLLSKGQGMDTTLSFGERTYGGIDLGDARRTARLIQSADDPSAWDRSVKAPIVATFAITVWPCA